ncbi:hypothetical protein GmRootV15_32770 [Variovorax sp. V15]
MDCIVRYLQWIRVVAPAVADGCATVENAARACHSYGYARRSVVLRSALPVHQHRIAPDQLRQRIAAELGEQVGAVRLDRAR